MNGNTKMRKQLPQMLRKVCVLASDAFREKETTSVNLAKMEMM